MYSGFTWFTTVPPFSTTTLLAARRWAATELSLASVAGRAYDAQRAHTASLCGGCQEPHHGPVGGGGERERSGEGEKRG